MDLNIDSTDRFSGRSTRTRKVGRRITNDYSPCVRICISIADRRNHLGACRARFLEGVKRIVAGYSSYLHVRVL
jgi:hypothetical protein